ncbi:MAG TPA: hypothetical protein VJ783_03345 [Pirellulales bacterium]|nr:hypothetical protein [Pirellulales bacterium]
MSSVPLNESSATIQGVAIETLDQRFRRLEAKWKEETSHLSSNAAIAHHPAFREIVMMGEPVVPLMLQDLSERSSLWVWALPELTGEKPVAPSESGKIARMSDAWVRWGRERHKTPLE